jgi:hypothetical protein
MIPTLVLAVFALLAPATSACTTTNKANIDCEQINDATLITARNLWFTDQAAATAQYGAMSDW